ncbi:site-2 protease family protein [Snodgrassella sp. CFCC 13594]|uniref:site-2 protease family protein n=1 Tax=Snodgrassella sp. CFCC 13594 TaxID=1775559 RepID=UPI0008349E9E|nr:site-2 protease family protein [Snodgrassella sp. CFCC 13594]
MDASLILLAILPMIFAFTVSEAARGFAAYYCGDATPKQYGRLTFNPTSHIDPIGTIVVPLVSFAISSLSGMMFIFGWAKPMPVDPRNFRNWRQGQRLVSLAGPLSNFMMCFVWGLAIVVSQWVPVSFQDPLSKMGMIGISFNAWIMVLSLLPILPMDGGRIVDSFLPPKASMQFHKIAPYGTWIILFLLIFGILLPIMRPIVLVFLHW